MKLWNRNRTSEADQAHTEAQHGLREARDRWPEVRRVSTSLRELRERNHFAESITATFRGEQT